jgi:membrane-bound lytic murein transglycosylase A
LHIQGSGTIELSNGESMAVGYDGDNGHDYFSIGRSLIREGVIAKENISMQSISKWMRENKKEAASLRQKNKRFIFFKERKKAEPVGASGTIVTPMHSAAVDNNFLMYHLPLWVNVENFYTDRPTKEYSNLFIAQDTGSAIKGATRIDLFLGKGKNAEKLAGSLNSNGFLWIFVPK